ncbi:copper chaperone PCu(A)C [Mesorhizobium sp. M4B.F.Ca.ET.215.01.1.1]|uniref:copper chaperone PCu(A)C n=3 Tax=Mesorhizobium TaxID=68287 RepID=UPI000FD3B37E|nr:MULTISPECIES: copper chaperone PCu(A)C [unclassified Mesorhizobium]RUW26664.1 copper chaperone PCu(A)C [Mesorhizobium sp. M4B.F.Ca.ET.013.02.1.1]RWF62492.1 MAG: copper chaperone PCu(A)C [Mesorhizobium sp.]TGQ14279.1 copper chaperone PCu(A)C [Mesorhizobium sp. M4B.F.Ca.ET.215.01.1.1]TGQ41809.1 copper chaperone PCu(A)C [Mesorhizobium sp. M4B.F.Ca.ET.214.01.1.1]TGQ47476.1 copper chaperone PCu(A)C [Mesorhizobium sp. M00.F.Ca.ET.220.01.1.1]
MFSFIATQASASGRSNRSRRWQRLGIVLSTLAMLLVGARAAFAHEFKAGDLEIEHPWSRATPAGAKVAGGYFTIINKGSSPDRLLAIASDISEKAELHEMGVKDGVMTMRPVSGGLEIPPGGKVALKPGAYHLMFVGLKRQPKQGEKFPATLTFEKAGSVTVEFEVEGMGETGDTDMDHAE